mgnify:FL=1
MPTRRISVPRWLPARPPIRPRVSCAARSYCDCFSAGQFCLPSCKCANCLNNADNEPAREEARRGILERNQHAFVSKVQRMRTVCRGVRRAVRGRV